MKTHSQHSSAASLSRVLFAFVLCLLSLQAFAASKITRTYNQTPLSEVLVDIDKAAPEIHITFIYDKLEDYPVTCTLTGASPMDAIRQVIGFYPVRVVQSGQNVTVEPIFDTEHKLTGRITDEAGQPLEFANVALFSLTTGELFAGGVATESGDFVIPCDEERVRLRASYIGYETAEWECAVGHVGQIVLRENATQLAEVRKNGTRPLARMERGALIYDMPFLLSLMPADDAYDALTRIPGVNEINGNMEFAGQQVTLIVNGKATTLNAEQTKERLKLMPADRLAKCEVMMSAPARYHVRGAVINIVTKDLYGQNHISGQLRAAGIFSKGNSGFGSGSLLWVKGRFSLDAGYNFYGGKRYAEVEHKAVQPLTTGSQKYYDRNESFDRSEHHSTYAQMEYAFAPNHRIGLVYNGQWVCSRNHNIASGTLPSEQRSTTKNHVNNVDVSYDSPFGLKLGASYMHFTYPQTQQLEPTAQSERQALTSTSGQDIDKWDFTADQTHTFTHNLTLNYGAQMKLTKHHTWQDSQLASGAPVDEATSSLGYTERITSAYASLSKEFGKTVSAEVGAQAENYHTPQWNEWRVFPTMNLMWNASPQNNFNLSFSSNSTYPDYWSLMSNVYYSSTYSEIWGNPALKPMNSYVMALSWRFRQRYMLTTVYQYDDNFITQLPYQPADRMAVVMQKVNFNSRQQFGFVASAQWKLGNWANGSVGGHYGLFRDRCNTFHDIPFDRLKWSGRLYATAALKPFAKHNLSLILQPVYQFKTIQGVYDILPFFSLDASIRWTDRTGRLSATLSANDLTNFNFRATDTWRGQNFTMRVNQQWRAFQLSLTYRLADYKAKQRKQFDTSRMGH